MSIGKKYPVNKLTERHAGSTGVTRHGRTNMTTGQAMGNNIVDKKSEMTTSDWLKFSPTTDDQPPGYREVSTRVQCRMTATSR